MKKLPPFEILHPLLAAPIVPAPIVPTFCTTTWPPKPRPPQCALDMELPEEPKP